MYLLKSQRFGILWVATRQCTRDYTAKQLQSWRCFTFIPILNSTVHVHVEWFSSRLSARKRLTKHFTRTMIRNFVLHRSVTIAGRDATQQISNCTDTVNNSKRIRLLFNIIIILWHYNHTWVCVCVRERERERV